MKWTAGQWNKRFVQQAAWTSSLRKYIYAQVGVHRHSRILEVGCGTGALTRDFDEFDAVFLNGIDIDLSRLAFAAVENPGSPYICADAMHLPYPDGCFDFVTCHYFLLWVHDPSAALAEMVRVTHAGGTILALAEPDHTARIDSPDELIPLGKAQTASLKTQGADPSLGRRLPELFSRAGLRNIQFGASGFQSPVAKIPPGWDVEWQVLEQDLSGSLPAAEIAHFKDLDIAAWKSGSRVLWVPTFYIYGTKSA